MSGSFSGFARVDNSNGGFIILIDWSWSLLGETKLRHNRSDISSSLGGSDSSNEFSFSGTKGYNRLSLRQVYYGSTRVGKDIPSSRASLPRIISICSINIPNKFVWFVGLWIAR